MSTDKIKDKALADIKASSKVDTAILRELEADGYAKIINDTDGNPIVARITEKGITFLENGGYKTKRKTKIKTLVLKGLQWLLGGLILAAITAIANKLIHP
ncbi:MAG: hypothetical protein NC209_04010 [Alistipes sp.]|nr:hypothetical protein [Lachnospiraceae bacterium]MCM1250296.1 hypothetical protein [Alistipes sp.]